MKYLAIIGDSFREALASRVLWVLLGLITLVLLALVPFTWVEQRPTYFFGEDLQDVRRAASTLIGLRDEDGETVGGHLWATLSPDTQQSLAALDVSQRPRHRLRRTISAALNELIDTDDLYQADRWSDATLDEEGIVLAERASGLTEMERRRLNRLAIEAAMPGQFRPTANDAVVFRYLVWDFDFVPPMAKSQASRVVETLSASFMLLFVGTLGVFIGVLVTAPMIPQTFAPGSINLLLSKPISRSWLFLAKFFGGCSFVLINAAYLAFGLWLIVGLRFALWKSEFLWCIPAFVFLFSIFYSVSALSGVVWRSTVMAIVMTIVFWFVCTIVGAGVELTQFFAIQPFRLTHLIPTNDDSLFAVRQNGQVVRWDATAVTWADIFDTSTPGGFGPPMLRQRNWIGPLFLESSKRLVAIKSGWPDSRVMIAIAEDGWEAADMTAAPRDTSSMVLSPEGPVLLVAPQGVYRLNESLSPAAEPINIFGLEIPQPRDEGYVQLASFPAQRFDVEARASFDRLRNELVAVVGDRLYRLRPADTDYEIQEDATTRIEPPVVSQQDDARADSDSDESFDGDSETIALAAANGTVCVAYDNGTIVLLDDTERREVRPYGDNAPRLVFASDDGRWIAALYQHDRLWLWDNEQQVDRSSSLRSQGQITAVHLDSAGSRLLVGDQYGAVSSYALPDVQVSTERHKTPQLGWLQTFYRYGMKPLYTIFPKPSKLEDTVNYLLSGRETVEVDGPAGRVRVKLDPWGPVWSSAAFTAVVLLIACVYMHRQEF